MSEKLDLSSVKMESKGDTREYAPRLDFGPDTFTITDVESGESAKKKTPFMCVHFKSSKGIPFKEYFWLTANTLTRFKEFLIACQAPEDVTNSSDISLDTLKTSLMGRSVRLLIGGEEFLNRQGKKATRRVLVFKYFCEPTTIPEDRSRLKFDEKWHLKRLPESEGNSEEEDDDLPF